MSTRCGYVAILGRPNVGKSTLLNHLLGQKVSITSRKPQTTRHNLLGILTRENTQILFVDTPGLHSAMPRAINRYMNRSARRALADVDVALLLIDRAKWTRDDDMALALVKESTAKRIIAINKIDRLDDKEALLPIMERLHETASDADIVPVSALTGDNLDELVKVISAHLPESPFLFDEDQVTDRSVRFLAAEIIREKVMRQLGEEVPYAVTIVIDKFEEGEKVTRIDATIMVEREGQKRILIGHKGQRLKRIGSEARRDMETTLERKVMLNTWVRVKASWSDDERALKSLGYDESL